MNILIVEEKISLEQLRAYTKEWFGDMVKFDVDIKRAIIALGGELHSDAKAVLLSHGSKQQDVWGANVYPYQEPDARFEYTSLINIRPHDQNPGMRIESDEVRQQVREVAERLLIDPSESL
jgi:hypothetical protein